jgi:WhiB family redox-sensing transcriptional regulator
VFYPDSDEFGNYNESDFDMAKSICSGCWLKEKCLDFAIKTNEKEGVWGGTTPSERRRIRRKMYRK